MSAEHSTGFAFVDIDVPAPPTWPNGIVFGLPNCGVVACAVVAGVDYAVAWQWFKSFGGNRGTGRKGNWKGRTFHVHYEAFLKAHGVGFERLYGGPTTVRRFVEFNTKPDRFYLIRARGHVMFVRNGFVGDQNKIAPADQHKRRKMRVLNVWEIIR